MAFSFSACGGDSSNENGDAIGNEEIAELYTTPDNFKGRSYEFTGMVLDFERDGDECYIQVYQDIKNYENNTVVTYTDSELSLKENDFIIVKGTVEGAFSGENYFGSDIEVPQVTATKVKKIDATEAFPAEKTIDVNKTVEKGSYKVTVSKVDFTADETRIYLAVTNNSSSIFDNYPDQGVIVQNGKQYEADWNEYYPEPSTELKSGATSESVIVFERVDETDFTYSFEGWDTNYDEIEFSFDISIK